MFSTFPSCSECPCLLSEGNTRLRLLYLLTITLQVLNYSGWRSLREQSPSVSASIDRLILTQQHNQPSFANLGSGNISTINYPEKRPKNSKLSCRTFLTVGKQVKMHGPNRNQYNFFSIFTATPQLRNIAIVSVSDLVPCLSPNSPISPLVFGF